MSAFSQKDIGQETKLVGGLCFVHGFGGSKGTWDKCPVLISDDPGLPALKLHEFGYKSGLKPFAPDIKKVSQLLLGRIGQEFENNAGIPLFLAAHSMGGVVVNTAIVDQLAKDKGLQYPLVSLRGVCYFASPLVGAAFAMKAKGAKNIFVAVARAFGLLVPKLEQKQLNDLAMATTLVSDTHAVFLRRVLHANASDARNLQVVTRHVLGNRDMVVKDHEGIAFMQGDRHREIWSDADHRSICKPKDRQDRGYIVLREVVHSGYFKYWDAALQAKMQGSESAYESVTHWYKLRMHRLLS